MLEFCGIGALTALVLGGLCQLAWGCFWPAVFWSVVVLVVFVIVAAICALVRDRMLGDPDGPDDPDEADDPDGWRFS